MFEPTFSEARRVGAPRWSASRAGRGELARIFEMRSNLFKNVHHFGNRKSGRGSAVCGGGAASAAPTSDSISFLVSCYNEIRTFFKNNF